MCGSGPPVAQSVVTSDQCWCPLLILRAELLIRHNKQLSRVELFRGGYTSLSYDNTPGCSSAHRTHALRKLNEDQKKSYSCLASLLNTRVMRGLAKSWVICWWARPTSRDFDQRYQTSSEISSLQMMDNCSEPVLAEIQVISAKSQLRGNGHCQLMSSSPGLTVLIFVSVQQTFNYVWFTIHYICFCVSVCFTV